MVVTAEESSWPRVLPNFGHVARTWDRAFDKVSARILPGEYYVTQQ